MTQRKARQCQLPTVLNANWVPLHSLCPLAYSLPLGHALRQTTEERTL